MSNNHPNRARRYDVYVMHWYNSGLGWELIDQPTEEMVMTRPQLEAYEATRNVESTSISVLYGDASMPIAEAYRGERGLNWHK